jgi:hypothetical protein
MEGALDISFSPHFFLAIGLADKKIHLPGLPTRNFKLPVQLISR